MIGLVLFFVVREMILTTLDPSCDTLCFSLELPFNSYFEYYGPEYRLDVPANNMKNDNTPEDLHNLKYVFHTTADVFL